MALEIKSTKLINKETGEVLMDTTGSTYKRIEEERLKPTEIDDKEITNKDVFIFMKSVANEAIEESMLELCGIDIKNKNMPEVLEELQSIWHDIEEDKKEPILKMLFGFNWQYLKDTLDKGSKLYG